MEVGLRVGVVWIIIHVFRRIRLRYLRIFFLHLFVLYESHGVHFTLAFSAWEGATIRFHISHLMITVMMGGVLTIFVMIIPVFPVTV